MNSLLVGVGISDRAAPGDDPVADAVTAEALGYDFVSAFDHPVANAVTAEALGYGAVPADGHPVRTYPTYETQTLLTWISARTTRIGIVPRVLGVPFRRPALVAKAAESLQRLSRGRLILGLGAGYRDAEIRAAGGPDLTPRAKVDGLQDAIAIIRAAWAQPWPATTAASTRLDDLDLEPKPARPIPIWLGALGPRGLALTGRLADGWIPFLRFAGPDRIPELLDRIRTASAAAGPRTRCAPSTASPSASTPRPAPPPASSPARPPTSPNSCTASPSWASPALTSCPAGTSCAPSPKTFSPHCANCRHPHSGQQPRRSPDRALAAVHPASRPRPAAANAPGGPVPEPVRAAS